MVRSDSPVASVPTSKPCRLLCTGSSSCASWQHPPLYLESLGVASTVESAVVSGHHRAHRRPALGPDIVARMHKTAIAALAAVVFLLGVADASLAQTEAIDLLIKNARVDRWQRWTCLSK